MKKLAATTPDELRAQADAQPVAWMYEHDGCVDTPLFTVNRWTKCEEPWNESPLFLHPAPAAPQAEPKREPLTYEQLVSACYAYHHNFVLLDPDEQEIVIEEAERWAKAFGIGDSYE